MSLIIVLLVLFLLLAVGGGGWWGYNRYYGSRQVEQEPYDDTFTPNPYPGTPNNPDMLTEPSVSRSHIDGRSVVSSTTFGAPMPGAPTPPPAYVAEPEPTPFFGGNMIWIILIVVLLVVLLGGGYYGYEQGWANNLSL